MGLQRMRGGRPVVLGMAIAGVLAAGGSPSAGAADLPASGVIDLATDANLAAIGGTAGDDAGWTVTAVGDVNGDGRPDVAVGAPRADVAVAGGARKDAGAVYLLYGPFPKQPALTPLALAGLDAAHGTRIEGARAGERLGTAIAPAGDVDGDGRADLIVGAPAVVAGGRGPGPGRAYVVFAKALVPGGALDLATFGAVGDPAPPAGGILVEGAAGDSTGVAVAGLGDIDGDGLSEFAVGAHTTDVDGAVDNGRVFVLAGRRSGARIDLGAPGAALVRITGTPGSYAGLALAGAVDPAVRGFAPGDLVVGAPSYRADRTAVGSAYLLHLKGRSGDIGLGALTAADGVAWHGRAGEAFGVSVGMLGDLDGDGRGDVGVGAPQADGPDRANAGAAYLLPTPAQAVAPVDAPAEVAAGRARRLDGAAGGDLLGTSIDGAGDVDGDGVPDVVVAAPNATELGRENSGAAYLVFGPSKAHVLESTVDVAGIGARGVRIAGPGPGGLLRQVAGAGDLTGDGGSDVLAGAFAAALPATAGDAGGAAPPASGPKSGAAFLVEGPTPVPPPPPLPPDPGVQEEVAQDHCTAATGVELILDDSGSMADTDSDRLRVQAVNLLLDRPRSEGVTFGAVEFGSTANELFPPQPLRAGAAGREQRDEIAQTLDRSVQADNGSTDYNEGFRAAATDQPAATARIFLTDGGHNEGAYADLHRGTARTYVVGLGIGRTGGDAARLRRIAKETRGRYYPSVTRESLQSVMAQIGSRIGCDIDLDTFVDTEEDDGVTTDPNDVQLDDDAHSADVSVSWADPDDVVAPSSIDVRGDDGRLVRRLSPAVLRRALKGTTVKAGRLQVSGARGETYYALRIAGLDGGRLRVRVRVTRAHGGRAVVHTQVAQSRRRR